mmetsp:Transcript_10222/g.12026  ORF Transcript_10222/g.12026 Transcript_10222/m.12026 type:complete len:220 (-) Transcript_10222:399-1058(-)|eukprot:CAMPEP_0185567618 /NCGR_PEP_ID=MMETSP0434-20130131/828_1 /TAXON_ID=626734 ORGANISM="Favella taraikaensis, Strain Fe Narragansett Bay" /NCGR_SAMPLE_ID=MMETSP0434 /ASSEMBLY_ACC=CAM_ASM_000379 /LENGTH=219 /DNA_ID=CAMNT_0028181885 /DNA_START=1316 /DNA_END=1975 /DNA_ORIENTATION=-
MGGAFDWVLTHMNACRGDLAEVVSNIWCITPSAYRGLYATSFSLLLLALLLLEHLVLQEFEILAENLDRKPVKIDGLATGLIHANGLFLDLLVFEHHELLNAEHLLTEALNGHELVVWLRLLNFVEDFENLVILVLDFNQTQLLLFVFADEANELATLLNLVKRLDELVGERLDPVNVLVLDLYEGLTDAFLPVVNDFDVLLVLDDCLGRQGLDLLELL